MSDTEDIFARFPQRIGVSSQPGAKTYTVMPEFYAVHGRQPGSPAPSAVHLFNEGAIGVFKGSPDQDIRRSASDKISPVYSLVPGGSPAVPTGLVFIRFADGVAVEQRTEEIKHAGYEVAESLAYAPNAAWLRARSGSIPDALAGRDTLEKIADVESVEPQMLMEATRR